MPNKIVNYAKCSRCKGDNDRGSQRMCSSCHVIANREYRERQRAQIAKGEEYKERIDELLAHVATLEDENIRLLARLIAAEAIVRSHAPYGEQRETKKVA